MDMRKWMMMRRDDEPRKEQDDTTPRGHYPPYYDAEDRFRDRRGREHYDNGRYAPRNKSTGTLTWDTREGDRDGKMDMIGFDDRSDERSNLRMIRGGENRSVKLDEDTAREWMAHLRNEDGTTGPHWTKEQATQLMKQKGINCDPLEFWVTLNMMYSDYLPVAQKANANNIDFYTNMAKAFLDDKDAVNGKLAHYYEYIVER